MFEKRLYKKFLSFAKKDFFICAKKHSTSLKNLKISDKVLNQFFENYEKSSLLSFLENIKTIIYSKKISEFILRNFTDEWNFWLYLKFLEKEKIIEIKRNGKIEVKNKNFLKKLPKPQTEKEIKRNLEKKLKTKIKSKDWVFNLFKKEFKFFPKIRFDQLPISQGSAIFVVKKILDYLPQKGKFLFVGDDDFISLILALTDSEIECTVCDLDEKLLENINFVARKYHLKIETKKVDVSKQKRLKEKFVGFLTNPVYTEEGVKMFVKFGKEQLGKDGGFGFLIVGDESIGNRFLFLQEFFSKENLIILEKINEKIFYPQISLYEEDKEIFKRFSEFFDKKIIKKIPKIGATLYVFEYLPKKPKKLKFKKSFYAYL
jgi:predicted methyltransferase